MRPFHSVDAVHPEIESYVAGATIVCENGAEGTDERRLRCCTSILRLRLLRDNYGEKKPSIVQLWQVETGHRHIVSAAQHQASGSRSASALAVVCGRIFA
eukprot:5597631-Pleurochrysis_carterae.AAC.3